MFDRRNEAVGGLAALIVGAAVVLGAPTVLPGATADPSDPASDAVSSDEYGYLDSSARCDDDQTLMAFGRTSRAMVAVCVDPDGELEYRGVRVSDQAATAVSASRASDGTVIATNNGVTYALSPAMLLVSEGDNVLYRDPLDRVPPTAILGGTGHPVRDHVRDPAAGTYQHLVDSADGQYHDRDHATGDHQTGLVTVPPGFGKLSTTARVGV